VDCWGALLLCIYVFCVLHVAFGTWFAGGTDSLNGRHGQFTKLAPDFERRVAPSGRCLDRWIVGAKTSLRGGAKSCPGGWHLAGAASRGCGMRDGAWSMEHGAGGCARVVLLHAPRVSPFEFELDLSLSQSMAHALYIYISQAVVCGLWFCVL
jgi:hypothetical protein